jgi:hypothetical protein
MYMYMLIRIKRWENLPPRWKEIIVATSVPALLIVLFIFGETLLRWEQYRNFGGANAVETAIDQRIWERTDNRRRPLPNARLGKVEFSEDGFRGKKLQQPKPQNRIRVGFFGSSTTIDLYVIEESQTWPAIAMQQLSSAFPDCEFDYFNAGVPGYNVPATLARLKEDAVQYKPDIGVFLLNDINSRAREQLRLVGRKMSAYKPSKLASASLLLLKLEKNTEALRLQRLAARPDFSSRLNLEQLREQLIDDLNRAAGAVSDEVLLPVFVENATRLRKEDSVEEQINVAKSRLLYMPGIYIGDIVNALYLYNEILKEAASANNIVWIETLEEMPSDARYFVDTSHTNKSGSKLFGELVGQQLSGNTNVQSLISNRGNGCLPSIENIKAHLINR